MKDKTYRSYSMLTYKSFIVQNEIHLRVDDVPFLVFFFSSRMEFLIGFDRNHRFSLTQCQRNMENAYMKQLQNGYAQCVKYYIAIYLYGVRMKEKLNEVIRLNSCYIDRT